MTIPFVYSGSISVALFYKSVLRDTNGGLIVETD